jgi:serine/threonine protein kinase
VIDLNELRIQFPQLSNIVPAGSGGQKDVCKAELNGSQVALKIILAVPGFEERTVREIQAIKQLSSSYVPKMVDSGELIHGGQKRYYIIEDFIIGNTYRTALQQQPIQDFRRVLELTMSLLTAAADFERVKIVHRDIKPENIIVDQSGKIWILDFGIARHLNLSSLTPTNGFGIGTVGYAPPEQYRNLKSDIDSRADLFAIGMVVHESLTGSHFFLRGANDVIAVIHKMDRLDPPRLALAEDQKNEFSDFIASLCQRFQSRRPRSANEALKWFAPIFARLHSTIP